MTFSCKRVEVRRLALLGATMLAGYAAPALAQSAAEPAEAAAAQAAPAADQAEPAPAEQDIVVTGSRIQNGNNLPTPVTVVNTQLLQATTPASIPDGLNKLPAFNSTSTPNNAVNANGRGFGTPGNFLNLRALGPIRTLILQDGNRVPGTFFDTTVDTNMLPQLLISRVEVVTGGASAVYGSDAVTGVVNFITDNKFVGLKGVAQGGISTYGDAQSVRAGLAWGTKVGDRGHFEASVEYYKRNGIDDTASRPYGSLYPAVVGAGTAANPFTLVYGARQSNASEGGLVMTGPFAGMQFLPDGSLGTFNPGTPTKTANAAVGGDGGYTHNEWLLYNFKSAQAFGRFDYEFTDDIKGYVSARYATNRSFGASQIYTNITNATAGSPNNAAGSYPLWIYSGNAFLSAAQQTALTNSNTSSFAINRFDSDLMGDLALETKIASFSATAGLQGSLFGDFDWDAHYTHGFNRTTLTSQNNVNSMNFYAALDAVRDPSTGNTVCRVSITAPGAFPGCVPINLFGNGRASQAAKDFIFEDTSWQARNTLDDFGLNVTGTAFDGWAGPVKVAVGGEYRRAGLRVTTSVPDNSFNPQNLRLGPAGNALAISYPGSNLAHFKEVQSGAIGSEDVYEGNIEVNVPLLKDLPLIELASFNGAYRYTKYDAVGNGGVPAKFSANTWKLGLEWKVSEDFKLRATRSRDIRAPTLWDLYQAQVISASGVTDPLTGVAAQLNTLAGGNPNLKPEVAQNLTAGAVFTPRFMPGFSLSFDYFHVKIGNAIGAVAGTNPIVQSLCLASDGSSPYCALLVRPISYNNTSAANFPTLNISLSQNIAQVEAKGIDVEANYGTALAGGRLNLRALWTHQPTLTTVTIPGAVITNAAGTETQPRDKVNFTLNYHVGRFGVDFLERFASSIKWTGNPTQVFAIPNVPAYFQSDLNLSYDLGSDSQVTTFVNVANLFNAKGGIYQTSGFTGSIGLRYPNVAYADAIGRYFTAGVRFKF
jgi:iron complex outermembrane receptor protein